MSNAAPIARELFRERREAGDVGEQGGAPGPVGEGLAARERMAAILREIGSQWHVTLIREYGSVRQRA